MAIDHLPFLATFVEVAERASFTAAARQLGLTQAAVSQRIHKLEGALRVALFSRSAGRIRLTEAGKKLHAYARRILSLTAEATAQVTGGHELTPGELSLAASSVPGQHLLPHTLAEFRRRHPNVQVRVSVSDTDSALREVEQGRAHLGLVGGRGGSEHLDFRPFGCDELVLIVAPAHPWSRRKSVTIHELVAQPLVQREPGSASRRCLERSLENLGLGAADLNVVLELGNNEAIKEAVLEGLGVAILSRLVVQKDLQEGRLKALAVKGLSLKRNMFIVRDRQRALPAPAHFFLEQVQPESDEMARFSASRAP